MRVYTLMLPRGISFALQLLVAVLLLEKREWRRLRRLTLFSPFLLCARPP